MFCVHRADIVRLNEKKPIFELEVLKDEHLITAIQGKQRHLRLYPIGILEVENMDSFKISETKGCSTFCTGAIAQGASTCLCVASKKFIFVYEINRTKTRHKKMKEILCPNNIQFVELQRERLVVGYASTFAVYSVQGEGSPLCMCSSCSM